MPKNKSVTVREHYRLSKPSEEIEGFNYEDAFGTVGRRYLRVNMEASHSAIGNRNDRK